MSITKLHLVNIRVYPLAQSCSRFETSVNYKVIHINVVVSYRCFLVVKKCSSFLWWCRTY